MAGHVVFDGKADLRVLPGQTLVVTDPLDPGTWSVVSLLPGTTD